MKYLVAVALITMATAMPEPVRLLEPVQLAQPDIAPLMVPQEVMDQVALLIKFVDAAEADEETPVNFAVNFVDDAVNADVEIAAPQASDASDFAVTFVDEAVNVQTSEIAGAPEASEFAVNFVDQADNVEAPEAVEAPIDAVRIVDALESNAPVQIKIMDIPLPESVVLPLAESIVLPTIDAVKIVDSPLETSNDFAVKFVDIAEVDDETPPSFLGKVYDDARLR